MKKETLARAKKLEEEISKLKRNIRDARITQNNDSFERETVWRISESGGTTVDVPKNLYRIIGKFIIVENTILLNELESELEKL